jgi:hypothetical protein
LQLLRVHLIEESSPGALGEIKSGTPPIAVPIVAIAVAVATAVLVAIPVPISIVLLLYLRKIAAVLMTMSCYCQQCHYHADSFPHLEQKKETRQLNLRHMFQDVVWSSTEHVAERVCDALLHVRAGTQARRLHPPKATPRPANPTSFDLQKNTVLTTKRGGARGLKADINTRSMRSRLL